MNSSLRILSRVALLSSFVVGAAAARAHVTLEYQVGLAATTYKAAFKVGHGCGASPTRQITVEIPAGVESARPMPKAGWALEIQRAPLAKPVVSHGHTVTEDVVRVTWTARTRDDMLPDAQYDEFVLSARLPAQPGTLHWGVRQICEQGRIDWVEVPQAGQKRADLKAPAATLEVLPAGAGGHAH
jgi:periplasmic copper chaperone A